MQPRLNNRRGFNTSGKFNSAEMSVPRTKPACTAIVSHTVSPVDKWNSATIGAFAAVAENHRVMPRNEASESHAS